MSGLLLRTTGPPGIFQVPLQLLGFLSKWGQAVLTQQEEEGLPWNSRQLGGETGAELPGFVELHVTAGW
jgi:hypothetical protein